MAHAAHGGQGDAFPAAHGGQCDALPAAPGGHAGGGEAHGPWELNQRLDRLRGMSALPSTPGPEGYDLHVTDTPAFISALRTYAQDKVDPELLDDRVECRACC